MRTRRAFKAFLAWDAKEGKVVFEFEPRASKFPPRKTAAASVAPAAKTAAAKAPAAKKVARKVAAAKK
jgi:DNA topoisomerase-3